MALPVDRDSFTAFVLSRLGDGAIKVNVTEPQITACIDYAVRKAMDYHFDFTEVAYISTQITDQNKSDRFIAMPDSVWGAIEIFPLSTTIMGQGMFAVDYQFVLNNFEYWTTFSLQPYFMAMQNLQMIQEILVGQQPIRYNRFKNKVYIDMLWDRVATGDYIVIKAYEVIDPDTYTRMWQDTWLMDYSTAQIKKVWGSNLKKFPMPLTGSIVINGKEMYDEAVDEIKDLEDQLLNTFSIPSVMMIG